MIVAPAPTVQRAPVSSGAAAGGHCETGYMFTGIKVQSQSWCIPADGQGNTPHWKCGRKAVAPTVTGTELRLILFQLGQSTDTT